MAILLLLTASSFAQCQILGSPGSYVLKDEASGAPYHAPEIEDDAMVCVLIASSDIIFDCDKYSIKEDSAPGLTHGIATNGTFTNVTIRNCQNVLGYDRGVYVTGGGSITVNRVNTEKCTIGVTFRNCDDSCNASGLRVAAGDTGIYLAGRGYYIRNVSVSDQSSYGMQLSNVRYSTITASNFSSNSVSLAMSSPYRLNISYSNFSSSTDAIRSSSGSGSITVSGNSITGNSGYGIIFTSSGSGNSISSNVISGNGHGIYLSSTSGDILLNNLTSNTYGIYLSAANNSNVSSNNASGSSYGVYVLDSGGAMLRGGRLFANGRDLYVSSSSEAFNLSVDSLVLDNPYGMPFSNFTNISMNDTVIPSSSYWMNWSSTPFSNPENRFSFASKYLNITNASGTVSLDTVSWNWLDSELSGFNESSFELWVHSGSGWSQAPGSLDTTSNSFTASNLIPASGYGLFQNNASRCMVINASGTYGLNANVYGATINASELSSMSWACIKIASSNVHFDCNGFLISNNGTPSAAGIAVNGSVSNPISNVTISNCRGIYSYQNAIYINYATLSSISNISAFNASMNAIRLTSSSNFSVVNCTINGSSNGMFIQGGSANNLSGNVVCDNEAGLVFGSSPTSVLLSNNTICRNTNGIEMTKESSEIMLSENLIHSNGAGVRFFDCLSANLSADRFYGNGYDIFFEGMGSNTRSIRASRVIFTNPSGSLSNYTNLSFSDDALPSESYSMSWTSNSSYLPGGYESFGHKFINISRHAGAVSIDSITWHWLPLETAGYNDNDIWLFYFNGSAWGQLSHNTTASLGITMAGFSPGSEYGLLQQNATGCFNAGVPGARYVLLSDLFGNKSDGACITISADNVTIDGNGHSIIGNYSGTTYGLYSQSRNGLRVENLTVYNYSTGIRATTGSEVRVGNCSVNGSAGGTNFDFSSVTGLYVDNISSSDPAGTSTLFRLSVNIGGYLMDSSFGETSAQDAVFINQAENFFVYGNLFMNSNSATALFLRDSADSEVFENDFIGAQNSMNVSGGTSLRIYDNRISGASSGISLHHNSILTPLNGIILEGNNITGNSGVSIYSAGPDSTFSTIRGNVINVSGTAVNITNAWDNGIYNNVLNASIPAYDISGGNNDWNTTRQAGPNVIGGAYIGGNFYPDYNGTDTDGDGIGDTEIYSIPGGGGTDYLPLTNRGGDSCHEISSPGTHYLHNDISGSPIPVSQSTIYACMLISSSDVIFDCGGHAIQNKTPRDERSAAIAVNGSATYRYTNITIMNCPDVSAYDYGVYIRRSDGIVVRNTTARSNDVYGFYSIYSSASQFISSTANDNPHGFFMESSTGTCLNGSSAFGNDGDGFSFYAGSSGNNIQNSSAWGNGQNGFFLDQLSTESNVTTSHAMHNGLNGFYFTMSDHGRIEECTAYNNSVSGFYVESSSEFVIEDNEAYNNTDFGFSLLSSPDANFSNNVAYGNGVYGFFPYSSPYVSFSSDISHSNGEYGFYVGDAGITLSGIQSFGNGMAGLVIDSGAEDALVDLAEIHGNLQYGLYVSAAENTRLQNLHLYDNEPADALFRTNDDPRSFTAENITIDSDSGSYSQYCRMMLADTLGPNEEYTISWASVPTPLPDGLRDFRGKFIDITRNSGAVSIDSILWSWDAQDLSGYDESSFALWEYSSLSGWSQQNATLETGNHTLRLGGLLPHSDYGILGNITPTATSSIVLYGANVTGYDLPRFSGEPPGNFSTEGGNLSLLDLNVTHLTGRWAAFFGNVGGNITLQDMYSSMVHSWSWNPDDGGAVCVSTNSSFNGENVTGSDAADIDTAWGFPPSAADSASNTFTDDSCNIGIGGSAVFNATSCDTGIAGGFMTCSIMATVPAPSKTDFLFCTRINGSGVAYNGQTADYELIVPTPLGASTETYYFYANLG